MIQEKLDEFSLIRHLFSRHKTQVQLGVGDDCALLQAPSASLAISTDTLVEGVHFFSEVDPFSLGHKSLAVNLSDLAAMGAKPLGFTLALSLPTHYSLSWVTAYAQGLYALADEFSCPLIGGDTTRHPSALTITITVFGEVDAMHALRRDKARVGDDIWVSGELGDAAYAVDLLYKSTLSEAERQRLSLVQPRLDYPRPRLSLGQGLCGIASAGLDISDGLAQDLSHILMASQVGARLELASLPCSSHLSNLMPEQQLHYALNGGDVYELCFCALPEQRERIHLLGESLGIRLSRVGTIIQDKGLWLQPWGEGIKPYLFQPQGYNHFKH